MPPRGSHFIQSAGNVSVLLAALCVVRPAAAQGGLVIAEQGQSKATIVIAQGAGEKVRTAADELRTYVEKMSGAKLTIADDAAAVDGAAILVGRSALTEAMNTGIPSGLTPARREEGFIVRCSGDRLVLAGNDEGPYHGTEYAVYELLGRLGVRWYMPGEYGEYVPSLPTVTVPELDLRETPDFIMRSWWLHLKPELAEPERRWKLRNKMNPDAIFATPGDSSVRNVLPSAQDFTEHPEYFAMNEDGSRNPNHPDLTNPDTIRLAAEKIKDYFRQHPGETSYGFAPDDGLPRDFSPETLKLHQGFVDLLGRPGVPAEASTTEEWLHFVNAVAREVRAEFPDVYIATNGYANRNLPPQGIELDDHLIIMFAAIWSCTLHAYDDNHCWQRVRQAQMLKQWTERCKNVWVYNYDYQMLVSCLTPLPHTRRLAQDLPLMRDMGVIGFNDEARNVWAEGGIASRYLHAQLEWNADAKWQDILEGFYANWYGAAAEPMRALYDAIEDAIWASPLHGHEDRILPYLYTPELVDKLRSQVERAEELADSDRARLHVRADRLILEHLAGYVAMHQAEWAGEFANAAECADKMMALRGELHAIDPFYIWYDEERYHSGIWYWGLAERRAYYQQLADMTSGKTGDLITLLPEIADLRTDPYDDGIAEEWYAAEVRVGGWEAVSTTRPFYTQGHEDEHGHTDLGYVWYHFRVPLPESAAGRRVHLYAPVVETEAWTWVNGRYVGHRPYREAYIRPAEMDLDITDAVRPGEDNTIAIRVSTSLASAAAAGGLQSRLFIYAEPR